MSSLLQPSGRGDSARPWTASDSGISRLLPTSAGVFAVLFTGAGIGCLAQIGTARLIGAESFGSYAYVLAWTVMLAYFATLGFNVSLLRLVPALKARQDWAGIRGILRFAVGSGTAAGLLFAALTAVVVLTFGGDDAELKATFLIGLLCVPLTSLRLIQSAAVRAFGGIIRSMIPERVVRDSLALLALALAIWAGIGSADAVTAMAALLLSTLVTVWMIARYLRRLSPALLVETLPRYEFREWSRPALPLTIIMLADTVMSRAGILALGARGEMIDAGIFSVAFSLALLAALPRMAVAALFAPTVSELHARNDSIGLQNLSARSALISLFGTALIAIPLIAGASTLLSFFGPEFVRGHGVVVILTAAQLMAAAAGPQQHLITMTGFEREGAALIVSAAALNLVGAALLSVPFGMTGAALATAAGIVCWNIAMAIFIQRRLGLAPGLVACVCAKDVPLGLKWWRA